MPGLSELTEKQSSSKSWIWACILGVVIVIAAAIVWWQVRRLSKKVNKLEGEKAELLSRIEDLKAQLVTAPNEAKISELELKLIDLKTSIEAKESLIAELRAKADAKLAELDSARPW